ncbi:4-(cytidine 5'-diphospho)-2-C-methyl-D-erythritol kinase [Bacteroides sp. 519]|uniref:4-(cytidine 5'-diphospho)-2-C-methyl-D-erythritol kinase n=1 Tax=Bacteroides sp. 519 TaxID=2302937 RepID=UPI0013D02A1E|nr:4-(cytidine 5'-diphospho)-2-C-methyl-D-erythritol kinase [Bacteroides sp. 519]NDV59608.1 4-(cytidine 5'-diphospho)-2-C-methyl-D-erythritol kinase [Bacteroides sp. 519]
MITFPNAKINLGLNIVEKRQDGYHNLETVFYPIPWEDALEIVENPHSRTSKCVLTLSGKVIPDSQENLVVKAYNLLDKDFNLPNIDIYLYKNIPLGAGLGGGSADAAFMLKTLNTTFNLNLSDEQLENHAAQLGADCAFFIKNQPVYAEGIGNIFTPITLSMKGYQIVIIKPDIFVSTKDAFSNIKVQKPLCSIKDIIKQPVETWKDCLVNDFEFSVFSKYPEIATIKQMFYDSGAIYASMSGSGSSVYGIYSPGFNIPEIKKEGMEYFYSTLF